MIRLVATDLDGTLWGPDLAIPDAHAGAISELARRGIQVLAATARRPRVVRTTFQRAGVALPAVLMDGAVGVDFRTEHRFHQVGFAATDASAVLSSFLRADLDPVVYVDDPHLDVVVSATPSSSPAHIANFGEHLGTEDLATAVTSRFVYGFSVLGETRARLERAVELLRSTRAEVMLYPEPTYGQFGLVVNAPGITKWNGIEAYCRLHDITAAEVLAVGDGDNDITMLARAGVAVAVTGGTRGVLDIADHQIAPPSQGGWAGLLDLVS